ncbi:MAG TPA: hypothetical protein VN758_12555 [Solirubrobacterales bacterium]|nr:hypothetical protein [Solirubrobacterales bacterium]
MRHLVAAALAALGALLLTASPAAAAASNFSGASGDGEAAFFTTTDQLVPGDTDTRSDVYERSYDGTLERYVTREVSTGPIGGNDAFPTLYDGASVKGTKVFFSTKESLVVEDTDRSEDVYMRDLDENSTVLVSVGDSSCAAEACGKGEVDSSFAPGGVIPSGKKVFFRSAERLAADDEDNFIDVYVRDLAAARTVLVSKGDPGCAAESCGSGNFAAVLRGTSEDGTKAFLATDEKLTSADKDSFLDIYQRNLTTGVTTLVSAPLDCPVLDCSVSYGGASNNGSHVYFETNERLSAEDGDSSQDVYDWAGGVATLVSAGPAGNGAGAATFAGASADGSTIFFATSDTLDGADKDESADVYRRAGGVTTLVSTGTTGGNAELPASFRWISPDGSSTAILFETEEALTAADTDKKQDIYRWAGGVTTLISNGVTAGNGEFNASFSGASSDGAHVFLVTTEPLVSQDTDAAFDVYDASGGTVHLVSTGPVGGKGPSSAGLPLGGVAEDGSHAFFISEERLTVDDLDAETDIYDGFASGTLLVSTGNSAPLGPPTPSQLSTDPASPGESLTPRVKGQSDPNTAIKIYATPDCSGAPVATGTFTQLGGVGIPVSVLAGSTTSFRATATDINGDTSPCSASVSYAQQSAPPPPPPPPPSPGGGGPEGGTGGSASGGSTTAGGGSGAGAKHGDGVVHVTPHTLITFGPASKTRARRPVFRFADTTGQAGTSFSCKIDRSGWRSCGSPLKLKRLHPGKHVFQVKAVNAVGMAEPAPVKRAFKVVGR